MPFDRTSRLAARLVVALEEGLAYLRRCTTLIWQVLARFPTGSSLASPGCCAAIPETAVMIVQKAQKVRLCWSQDAPAANET